MRHRRRGRGRPSSYDGGGERSECSAAKAARHLAKLSDAAATVAKKESLLAEAVVQQLRFCRTGSLHRASLFWVSASQLPFFPQKGNVKPLTLAVGND